MLAARGLGPSSLAPAVALHAPPALAAAPDLAACCSTAGCSLEEVAAVVEEAVSRGALAELGLPPGAVMNAYRPAALAGGGGGKQAGGGAPPPVTLVSGGGRAAGALGAAARGARRAAAGAAAAAARRRRARAGRRRIAPVGRVLWWAHTGRRGCPQCRKRRACLRRLRRGPLGGA